MRLPLTLRFWRAQVYAYGDPRYILTGNDKRFASRFFNPKCVITDYKPYLVLAYHPEKNGQTGRFNRTTVHLV